MKQDREFTAHQRAEGVEEAMEKAAEEAWTAYREAVDGKAKNGDPLPSWAELRNDPAKQDLAARWLEATKMATLFSCAVSVDTMQPSVVGAGS
jgi:hypothetical protein